MILDIKIRPNYSYKLWITPFEGIFQKKLKNPPREKK